MGYLRPAQARSVLTVAGAPVAGTDEVQTLTISGTPTGGSYKLKFKGQTTSALAHNAAAAAIDAALEALSTIGSGNVAVTGTGPFTITFGGSLAKKAVPLIEAVEKSLTGGSSPDAAVTEATPGVDATHRGAIKGALLTDTTNGKLYINTGTSTIPTWTVVGTQT